MENLSLIFKADTHVGLKRAANEDSFGTASNSYGNLFVVCDGMGGHKGGAVASKTAVDCILEYFQNHEGENPVQAIHESIKFANTQIFAKAHMDPELHSMGTTCVVLLIQNDGKAYFGHVGDSRIYLLTGGQLVRLTKDHSFVQMLVDSGEISESEAESHPKRNQILKALGIDEHVKPEICSEAVCPAKGDVFLLCSDGLSGMTSESSILDVLKNESKSGYVAQLIQLALDGGGKDNITAVAVEIESSPFAKTYYKLNHVNSTSAQKNIATPSQLPRLKKSGWMLLSASAMLAICLIAGAYLFFTDSPKSEPSPIESPIQDSAVVSKADSGAAKVGEKKPAKPKDKPAERKEEEKKQAVDQQETTTQKSNPAEPKASVDSKVDNSDKDSPSADEKKTDKDSPSVDEKKTEK